MCGQFRGKLKPFGSELSETLARPREHLCHASDRPREWQSLAWRVDVSPVTLTNESFSAPAPAVGSDRFLVTPPRKDCNRPRLSVRSFVCLSVVAGYAKSLQTICAIIIIIIIIRSSRRDQK